jgi:ketosteroid isomerase-like protein
VLALAAPSAFAQVSAEPPPRLPSVELPAELDRVLRDYEQAWASGDAEALTRLFTTEGFVSGDGGWIRGRERIRERYANAGGALRLRALDHALDGDAGFIVGAYGYGDAADQLDAGRFILALRRDDDGRWLIAADLDASNARRGGG